MLWVLSFLYGGFAIAIWQVTRARTAARAAEIASKQTRDTIATVLTVGDLNRAIQLIQRIKDFHRDQKWEVSLQHYQILRATLTDIRSRLPDALSDKRLALHRAIPQISVMETSVDQSIREDNTPNGVENFSGILNSIQLHLEEISSSTQL